MAWLILAHGREVPIHIPFEPHGRCHVALVCLKGQPKWAHHFAKTIGKGQSWAVRDYLAGEILRSGNSNLTASELAQSHQCRACGIYGRRPDPELEKRLQIRCRSPFRIGKCRCARFKQHWPGRLAPNGPKRVIALRRCPAGRC